MLNGMNHVLDLSRRIRENQRAKRRTTDDDELLDLNQNTQRAVVGNIPTKNTTENDYRADYDHKISSKSHRPVRSKSLAWNATADFFEIKRCY
jgi:hypothetical protein